MHFDLCVSQNSVKMIIFALKERDSLLFASAVVTNGLNPVVSTFLST